MPAAEASTVPENMGGMQFNAQVQFPYLPLITNFSNNPVTKDLRSIMFPFATDIKFTGDTNKVKFKPLAFTSDESGLKDAPVQFEINHKWDKRRVSAGKPGGGCCCKRPARVIKIPALSL